MHIVRKPRGAEQVGKQVWKDNWVGVASISESSRQAEDCNATLDLAIRQLDRSRIEVS